MDFASSTWMSKLLEGERVTRVVDGNIFIIIASSENNASINGFPVTVGEWEQALAGRKVTLSYNGNQASLTAVGKNVMFNEKSITNGEKISTSISFNQNSKLSETGNSIINYIKFEN